MARRARVPASDFEFVVRCIGMLWLVFAIDILLRVSCKVVIAYHLGVRPREPAGLVGIIFAPLLHEGFEHLLANSFGLLLLGLISCGYGRSLTLVAVGWSWVLSGMLAWIIGASGSVHIGASGVIFGLIGFLLANGLLRRGCLPQVIALFTLLLYGAALPLMFPPQGQERMMPLSWEMHLGGFIGGVIASWRVRKRSVG
jgi:membrane associated rhomboid family serine protease